ncbi:MAG TPA: AAA family ATPase [Verrucomicrobiota bacterium]|jgi:DNA polymerase III delta prime subunit|nr:AAA family ATPase [Verrucomicrobiota bacterium]
MTPEQFLWVERYRPRTIEDCILPDEVKKQFQQFITKGEVPNLLLSGTAGTGKTTIARALCNELDCDYIVINGSDEGRQIDTLRTKIKQFASAVSFEGKTKVVILDEADYMNRDSVQPALRGFIEQFAENCRFIFTCNYSNRLIGPLHSRTTVIDFKVESGRDRLASKFLKRMEYILDTEGVEYSQRVLAELLNKHFPDYRRVINELQRYAVGGNIDEGILDNFKNIDAETLTKSLRDKDWRGMRKWVVSNVDTDPQGIFRQIYDVLLLEVKSPAQLVVLIADYQYKAAFVADQEINITACLTEIMVNTEFK